MAPLEDVDETARRLQPMTPSGDGVDLHQARWSAARLPPDRGEQPSLFE